MNNNQNIILASKSPSRAILLQSAGIPFDIIPSNVDEAVLKDKAKNATPLELGQMLAREKALSVSKENPGRLVLGADQILELGGRIFDKPGDMNEARRTLETLKGKTHTLISCVAFAKDGIIASEVYDVAALTMANFSDDFLEDYLKDAGERILSSVGAYQLEAEGARLFEKVDGDFSTILGLPLPAVVEYLVKSGHLKP